MCEVIIFWFETTEMVFHLVRSVQRDCVSISEDMLFCIRSVRVFLCEFNEFDKYIYICLWYVGSLSNPTFMRVCWLPNKLLKALLRMIQ